MSRALSCVLLVLVVVLVSVPALWEPVARRLFPNETAHVYDRVAMPRMILDHLWLSLSATGAATLLGVAIGIAVTRRWGRALIPLVRDLAALTQTIPPVAVLVLAVPLLGFGTAPMILALFLFSLLPILGNTVAGFDQVDRAIVEASRAMGMTGLQRLLISELPLAAPVILAGVRTAAVISVGTATIGATIGAGGLGVVIIGGLVRDNVAFTFAGAIVTASLALLVDWGFEFAARRAVRWRTTHTTRHGRRR